MKVYISSHDKWAALHVARVLADAGHLITSTWHDGPAGRSASYSDAERAEIASRNADQIGTTDALVLVAALDRVPGGKFVEAGIAIGMGKRVLILGARENLLMSHPRVTVYATPEDIAEALN